jgi:hypothetical protein
VANGRSLERQEAARLADDGFPFFTLCGPPAESVDSTRSVISAASVDRAVLVWPVWILVLGEHHGDVMAGVGARTWKWSAGAAAATSTRGRTAAGDEADDGYSSGNDGRASRGD